MSEVEDSKMEILDAKMEIVDKDTVEWSNRDMGTRGTHSLDTWLQQRPEDHLPEHHLSGETWRSPSDAAIQEFRSHSRHTFKELGSRYIEKNDHGLPRRRKMAGKMSWQSWNDVDLFYSGDLIVAFSDEHGRSYVSMQESDKATSRHKWIWSKYLNGTLSPRRSLTSCSWPR